MITDKQEALALVAQNGYGLRELSEELRDDEEVVAKAWENLPDSFQYASSRLKNDPQWCMKSVKVNCFLLGCIGESMRDNKEVVLAAIDHDWVALRYASERLKNDKEVILYAATKNAQAIGYASQEIRALCSGMGFGEVVTTLEANILKEKIERFKEKIELSLDEKPHSPRNKI